MDTIVTPSDHRAEGEAVSTASPRDYFDLMKPRVMTLVVFTANAYGFGVVAAVLSVLLMALASNYLAAGLLAFSIFFYAVIYTMILKRSTPQNIVIGGAAGAFPPMIGWVAVTGEISLDAVILFMIIFLWTPPHSWALALYKSGDYEAANIPMMPVARGAKSTRLQILIYSIVLVVFAGAPVLTGLGGAEDDRQIARRAVEMRLDHLQHEACGHGGVERIAAPLEDAHADGRGDPVGRGDSAEGAANLGAGGETGHLSNSSP